VGSLNALKTFLTDAVLPIAILAVAVVLIARSHRGEHSAALRTGAIALVGCFFAALAVSPASISAVGSWLLHLVTA
jgi:hypothetical protein